MTKVNLTPEKQAVLIVKLTQVALGNVHQFASRESHSRTVDVLALASMFLDKAWGPFPFESPRRLEMLKMLAPTLQQIHDKLEADFKVDWAALEARRA